MSNQELNLLSEINELKKTIKKLELEQKSTGPNCYPEAVTLATACSKPRIVGNDYIIEKLLDDEILNKPFHLFIDKVDYNNLEADTLSDARTLLLRHGYRFQYESRISTYDSSYLYYSEVWMKGT